MPDQVLIEYARVPSTASSRALNFLYNDCLYCFEDGKNTRKAIEALRRVVRESDEFCHNRKVGAFVAVRDGDKIKVGWSVCNELDKKKFDKNLAVKIATLRVGKVLTYPVGHDLAGKPKPIPKKVRKQFESFVERARRYFKDAKEVVPSL